MFMIFFLPSRNAPVEEAKLNESAAIMKNNYCALVVEIISSISSINMEQGTCLMND